MRSARMLCSVRVWSRPAGWPPSPTRRSCITAGCRPGSAMGCASVASCASFPRSGPPERGARRRVAVRRVPVHRHRAVRLGRRRHRRALRSPASPCLCWPPCRGRPGAGGEHSPALAAILRCALAQLGFADLVGLASLVEGSVRNRRLILYDRPIPRSGGGYPNGICSSVTPVIRAVLARNATKTRSCTTPSSPS